MKNIIIGIFILAAIAIFFSFLVAISPNNQRPQQQISQQYIDDDDDFDDFFHRKKTKKPYIKNIKSYNTKSIATTKKPISKSFSKSFQSTRSSSRRR